jgi:hypothetical protein
MSGAAFRGRAHARDGPRDGMKICGDGGGTGGGVPKSWEIRSDQAPGMGFGRIVRRN